jgi:hypothetical protein
MTESVGNETIENTGDFCLVIGTDHTLTEFFNLMFSLRIKQLCFTIMN